MKRSRVPTETGDVSSSAHYHIIPHILLTISEARVSDCMEGDFTLYTKSPLTTHERQSHKFPKWIIRVCHCQVEVTLSLSGSYMIVQGTHHKANL